MGVESQTGIILFEHAIGTQAIGNLVGDLTGSGNPEVAAAIMILRVVVQLEIQPPGADLWQWDCNNSGGVDVGDAISILRCVVGLDTWPIGVHGGDVTANGRYVLAWESFPLAPALRSLTELIPPLEAWAPIMVELSSGLPCLMALTRFSARSMNLS